MTVIDAHQHFWWLSPTRKHSWPQAAEKPMARNFTPADLLPELKQAGVDGTILIQSVSDYDETLEFIDLARKHDFIKGVVGWVPLVDPDGAARALDELGESGWLVGIRHVISYEPDPDWILQPKVLESLRLIARKGLVFDAVPTLRQMESMFKVAEAIPDLKIAMNHMARAPVPEQGWEPWASIVKRWASHPNVSLKLSPGLDFVTRMHWNTAAVTRYAMHIFECFGPGRVIACSNWPVVLVGGTYQEVWSGITELASMLPTAERDQVMGGAAQRVYGIR